MDVLATLRTQRAVREFDGRPLDPQQLHEILQAGARAPSSMNEQRWRFIAVTDRDMLHELSGVGDYADHLAGAAAGVAIVGPEASEVWRRESIAFDLGQVAQSMMLAAWDLGIGSAHASVYDDARTRELLAIPDGWRCDVILSLGYPADPGVITRGKSAAARRPLNETVHEERW